MLINFEHEGRIYTEWTVEDALAQGIPQATIDTALAANRAAQASKECRRRIYAIASTEAQMNMAAATAVISGKTASARSDEEKAILEGAEAAIGWVAAMRANVATLAADPETDLTNDAAWPACPPEALAMIANF